MSEACLTHKMGMKFPFNGHLNSNTTISISLRGNRIGLLSQRGEPTIFCGVLKPISLSRKPPLWETFRVVIGWCMGISASPGGG